MLEISPPEALRVVVASSDAAFRRTAGAALSRAGHEVYVAAATDHRAIRLARLRRAQVLVIDVSGGADLSVLTAATPSSPAVVRVDEPGDGTVVEKWGPLEALVASVERAGHPQDHLRVVPGE
jgi:hypothetical protein